MHGGSLGDTAILAGRLTWLMVRRAVERARNMMVKSLVRLPISVYRPLALGSGLQRHATARSLHHLVPHHVGCPPRRHHMHLSLYSCLPLMISSLPPSCLRSATVGSECHSALHWDRRRRRTWLARTAHLARRHRALGRETSPTSLEDIVYLAGNNRALC